MRALLIIALAGMAGAQTTVYLRSSAPQSQFVTGASNTTPVIIQTGAAHGLNVGDFVTEWGICTGSTASPANGIFQVITNAANDATHYAIGALSGGAAIAANGAYNSAACPGAASWEGKVTAFTTAAGPIGFLDGTNGATYRQLRTSTDNGLSSLIVSGCPGACVVTVTTSYAHGVLPTSAGGKTEYFSVTGSTSSTLNQAATANPFTKYQVASATTFTYTSTVVAGLTNGDFTTNAACGPGASTDADGNFLIGGSQNCVVVSQLAYTGNPFWDAIYSNNHGVISAGFTGSATTWKTSFDGGNLKDTQTMVQDFSVAPEYFLVDQGNANVLAAVMYMLQKFERYCAGAVNFVWNEQNGSAAGACAQQSNAISWFIDAGKPFLSSTNKAIFLGKMFNDVDDPTNQCTKTHNAITPKTIATGTAQGGSSTTIILSAGDVQADSFYVHNAIQFFTGGGSNCIGTVSAYVSSTKTATVPSWSCGTPPTSSTTYQIFATILYSVITSGVATVTGINTTFTSDLAAGDAVTGFTNYTGQLPPYAGWAYITTVTDDTHLAVVNGGNIGGFSNGSTTVYAPVWQSPKWVAGDCGFHWYSYHDPFIAGSTEQLYPTGGGNQGTNPTEGGNGEPFFATAPMLSLELPLVGDDSRAIRYLAETQSHWFDYSLRHSMHYQTGFGHYGTQYDFTHDAGQLNSTWMLSKSVPTYPSMDLTGPWMQASPFIKMFLYLPDELWDAGVAQYAPRFQNFAFASRYFGFIGLPFLKTIDASLAYAPGSTNAAYFRNFMETVSKSITGWNMGTDQSGAALVENIPTIGSSDFTVQPMQYMFRANSATACASLTGWACPATFRGDVVISRTTWTNNAAFTTATRSGTHLLADFRYGYDDHDKIPGGGSLYLYKMGALLANDSGSPGDGREDEFGGCDTTQTDNGPVTQFGGSNATANLGSGCNIANLDSVTPITRWASGNHGTWSTAYGDQSSNYAYWCANMAGGYNISFVAHQECGVHFKKATKDEFVINMVMAYPNSATQIEKHLFYPQNGESTASGAPYPEGTTTFASSTVTELEDGGNDGFGSSGGVNRNYGLITQFAIPTGATVSLRDDNTTYFNSSGHAHRISVCAGTCGSSTNTAFEVVIVHKIAQALADTTLTTTALNPDSNWAGAQACGAVSCAVFIGARNAATYATMGGFTTTHSGTAQYLIGGLTAGVYAATVGGTPVTGSPFVVAAGDNSIEFDSTSGAVAITAVTGIPPTITTISLPGGHASAAYSQTVTATGDPTITWSISAGSLCGTLALGSSTGTISGALPSSPQTCSFTVQASNNFGASTQPLSIVVGTALQMFVFGSWYGSIH